MERIRHGATGRALARQGQERHRRRGSASLGGAGHGRHGAAGRGMDRLGSEAHGRHGQDGLAWQGEALQAR